MDTTSIEKTPKFKYAVAVRMCDMDCSMFGVEFSSSNKKKNSARKNVAVPVRACDLNLEDEEPRNRPARKQLWSDKKEDKTRLSTLMKPDRKTFRMTTYNKQPSAASIKKIGSFEKSYTFKKPLLQSCEKKARKKLNLDPVNSTSKLKKPLDEITVPKIVLHKPKTPNENKKEPETVTKQEFPNKNIMDLINTRFDDILTKVDSKLNVMSKKYDEILTRLDKLDLTNQNICKKCICKPVTEAKVSEQTEKEESAEIKTENEEPAEIKTENKEATEIKTENKEATEIKTENEESTEIKTENEQNSSCGIVKTDKNTLDSPSKANIDQNTTLEINDLIEKPLPTFKEPQNKNKKSIEPMKKQTFEMLELKLQSESPISSEFSLSDSESPIDINTIHWLINTKDDFKSPVNHIIKPVVPKSHNDSVCKYNEIRKNITFLCTPKNTKTFSHLETPSVQNNHKKLISRRVQKQLLMLD